MATKNKTQKKTSATPSATTDKATNESFAFGRENYLWMLIGIGVIALGFILMSGSEDIFSTTKLTIAPILVLGGFVIEAFAIMRKPKD